MQRIEIDQSGKIENTTVCSVVSDSVGSTVYVSPQTKRGLLRIARSKGKSHIYVMQTFAFLCARIISKTYSIENHYVIDVEYPNNDGVIKSFLMRYLARFGIQVRKEQITFSRVGKKSSAHAYAHACYTTKNKKASLMLSLRTITRYLP